MNTAFQNILIQIVKGHGIGILDNAPRCKTLLETYTKGACKRESRLFLISLEAGCHQEILSAEDQNHVKNQLIQKLQDEYGIKSAFAEEIVSLMGDVIEKWKQTGKEKIPQLEKSAQKGDYRSQYELGLLYERLNDYTAAIHWLKEAAKQGLLLSEQPVARPFAAHAPSTQSSGAPHPAKATAATVGTLVFIKGGTFIMGSPLSELERHDNENQHPVKLTNFYIGKYLVTQDEYEALMGTNPSNFKGEGLPVECVSWYDAIEYCNKRSSQEGLTPVYMINKARNDINNNNEFDNNKWTISANWNANGYRLPTEAEWEYACRAGTATPFYTGSSIIPTQANYDGKDHARQSTSKVGSFPPNPWSLYDMHGNVFEWCWDWYGGYSGGITQIDPLGAPSGTHRVLRGGSWNKSAQSLRSAYRVGSTPSLRSSEFGFRLARFQ
ncbi:MAG: SUMF1/EgtB/PvdO family nonheme iron enzyme [Spirochaetaceae bacterium]|jgi:formylglycine-generating enzyme required for sulfatase activity|nr:SUMF1/EgtB/PvdO family nonheme iron enzyme [Spirochaetaceae bacterium]